MTNLKNTLFLTLLCTFFWCVLHESFEPDKLISGFILSVIIMVFYERFLSLPHFTYRFPLRKALPYLLLLFVQIFKSGWQTAKILLKNEVSPTIVILPTKLENEWYKTLVANSITLTPGTVSIDISRNHYVVLCIAPYGKNAEEYYASIAAPFEALLMKGDTHA